MGLGSRSTRHTAGINQEDFWAFRPGDRVLTREGVAGVVTAVFDGPYPGTEQYDVTLDGNMGGGTWGENELELLPTPVAIRRSASREDEDEAVHTAAQDYPELAEILVERPPPPAVTRVSAAMAHYASVTLDTPLPGDQCAVCGNPANVIVSDQNYPSDDPSNPARWGLCREDDDVDSLGDLIKPLEEEASGLAQSVWGSLQTTAERPHPLLWLLDKATAPLDKPYVRPPAYQDPNYSYDWCRFRRNSHCWYPKELDIEATNQASYAVWKPFDRGICARTSWDQQKECPMGAPGPHSHEEHYTDATVPWEQGGQQTGAPTSGWSTYPSQPSGVQYEDRYRTLSSLQTEANYYFPDGREVDLKERVALGVQHGVLTPEEAAFALKDKKASWIATSKTDPLLYHMWARGELDMRSSVYEPDPNSQGVFNQEVADYFRRSVNAAWDPNEHPRGQPQNPGEFAPGDHPNGNGQHPAHEDFDPEQGPPVPVHTIDEAIKYLGSGKGIMFERPQQAVVLLDKIADIAKEAMTKGEKAPNYDLCDVYVGKVSLFCLDNVHIPRRHMPQLSGVPAPGSRADALEKNDKGEVNLAPHFEDYLKSQNIEVSHESEFADRLRASQNELNGAKVAGMCQAVMAGKLPPGEIFISEDNYVVDGHHRWAANVGAELHTGKDIQIPVIRVHMKILPLLAKANNFAEAMGVGSQPVTAKVAFEFLASWNQVRAKAKQIRAEGGVRIIAAPSSSSPYLVGEVQGTHGLYTTSILRQGHGVAMWECGCPWSSYSWGRTGPYQKYEGRMCSHALALLYEAQSRGMFGRDITEDAITPMPDNKGILPSNYPKPHAAALGDVVADTYIHETSADFLTEAPVVLIARGMLEVGEAPASVAAWISDLGGDVGGIMTTALMRGGGFPAKLHNMLVHVVDLVRDGVQWMAKLQDGRLVAATDLQNPTYDPSRGLRVGASVLDPFVGAVEGQKPPSVSGVAIKAADTGRVLLIQRSNNDESDPAAGLLAAATGAWRPTPFVGSSATDQTATGAVRFDLEGFRGVGVPIRAGGLPRIDRWRGGSVQHVATPGLQAEVVDIDTETVIAAGSAGALSSVVAGVIDVEACGYRSDQQGVNDAMQFLNALVEMSVPISIRSAGSIPSVAPTRFGEGDLAQQSIWQSHVAAVQGQGPPSVAGVAVKARDTGRILLIQRSNKDDNDPAAGTWEMPGGHMDEGESPWDAGKREWEEETGHAFPDGEYGGHWTSPNGVYQGHVWVVPSEDDIHLNMDPENVHVLNPDDPDRDDHEVACWWDPKDLPDMPALRKEVRDTDWKLIKKASTEDDWPAPSGYVYVEDLKPGDRVWYKGNNPGATEQVLTVKSVDRVGEHHTGDWDDLNDEPEVEGLYVINFEGNAGDGYYGTSRHWAEGLSLKRASRRVTAQAQSTGVMIALRPPEDVCQAVLDAYDGPNPEPFSEQHITLLYLGKTADLDRARIERVVESFAMEHAPLIGSVTGWAEFHTRNDGMATVALWNIPGIESLVSELRTRLHNVDITPAGTYGYIAHETVGYHEGSVPVPTMVPEGEATFGSIILAYGGEWTWYDFGSGEQVEIRRVAAAAIPLDKPIRCRLIGEAYHGGHSRQPGETGWIEDTPIPVGTEGLVVAWTKGGTVPYRDTSGPTPQITKHRLDDHFLVQFPDVAGPIVLGQDRVELLDPIPRRKAAKDPRFEGVGLKQDDKGKWYVTTHRARSKSYDTPEDIPQSEVDFIESTGSVHTGRFITMDEARGWARGEPVPPDLILGTVIDGQPTPLVDWINREAAWEDRSGRTQITRKDVSVPTRILLQNGLIQGEVLHHGAGQAGSDTEAMAAAGATVTEYEPFPRHDPAQADRSRLDRTYDTVVSNYVLNVLPPDQRDAAIRDIARSVGQGRGYITVRGAGDSSINGAPFEDGVLNPTRGTFQKGYLPDDLVAELRRFFTNVRIIAGNSPRASSITAEVSHAQVRTGSHENQHIARVTEDADEAAVAEDLAKEAERYERQVSPILNQVSKAVHGHLEGFPMRLKERAKLVDKVHRTVIEKHLLYPAQAWSAVGDALRYTVVFPEDEYVQGMEDTLAHLESHGFKPVGGPKNYWLPYDPYQGVNCNMLTPDGFRWELQFHTMASFDTKEKLNHKDYEVMRSPDKPLDQRQSAWQRMTARASKIPIPPGVLGWHPMISQPMPLVAGLQSEAATGRYRYFLHHDLIDAIPTTLIRMDKATLTWQHLNPDGSWSTDMNHAAHQVIGEDADYDEISPGEASMFALRFLGGRPVELPEREDISYFDRAAKVVRDTPATHYGFLWNDGNPDRPNVVAAKSWDGWDKVPATQFDLSRPLHATEPMLSSGSINRVVSGEQNMVTNYDPRILIDDDQQAYVIDGHHRIPMHRGLGHTHMPARIIHANQLRSTAELHEAARTETYRGVKIKTRQGRGNDWGYTHLEIGGHNMGRHMGDEEGVLRSWRGTIDDAIDNDPDHTRYEDHLRPGHKGTKDPNAWQGHRCEAMTLPEAREAKEDFIDFLEAELHDEPEPALPETDGADGDAGDGYEAFLDTLPPSVPDSPSHSPEDGTEYAEDHPELVETVAAVRMTPAGASDIAEAAKLVLKHGSKAFTHVEQQAIITEGEREGSTARNLGDLRLEGTHYLQLEEALQSQEDDDCWLG